MIDGKTRQDLADGITDYLRAPLFFSVALF
jgi:hypothetical protein